MNSSSCLFLASLLLIVFLNKTNLLRSIVEPKPGLPPAEHTLVGAGQAGRGLHTAVRLDPIESVFIAASSSSQH